MPCPIWPEHTTAETHALPGASGGLKSANLYRCPTCGEFEMSWQASVTTPRMEDQVRWALSWATRNASEQGTRLRLLTDDVQRTIESVTEPRNPLAKIDLLIKLLGSRARALGERAPFDPATDWPLILARGAGEAVQVLRGHAFPGGGVALTLKAWERLAELGGESRPRSTKVFVAMWFDRTMNAVYDQGFHRALYALGYDPIRVDREQYLGKVDDFIIAGIRESALLVADFTGHRGGVYYEAGFAHGLGLPVVFTCREDQIREAHFDTRQYNHITWTTPADLAEKLRARIEATIPNRPKPRG